MSHSNKSSFCRHSSNEKNFNRNSAKRDNRKEGLGNNNRRI